MKYLKYFKESEIYVGTNKHYNKLKAVKHQIFDVIKLIDYKCDICNNEFKHKDLRICPVCDNKNLIKI